MRHVSFYVIILTLVFWAPAASEEVWTPKDMMLERALGGIAVSLDGRWVAYTVREAIMEPEKSEYLTHIWVARTDGSRNFQLTQGEKSCGSPAWSPDGEWIAFLTDRSGKNNIWLIRLNGGEARRLTDVETGVGSYKWSPDGGRIAFLMSDPESEEEKEAKKAKRDPRIIGKHIKFTHIYTVPTSLGEDFPEPKKITEGNLVVDSFDWSPDGRTFVFARQPLPGLNYVFDTDISLVGSTGGEIKTIVKQAGIDREPRFSPDGKWIAFQSARGSINWAFHGYVALVSVEGGDIKYLPPSYDLNPSLIRWRSDGKGLFFNEPFNTAFRLYYLPIDGGPPEAILSPGDGTPGFGTDVSAAGDVFAYVYEDMDKPPELYVQLSDQEPVKVSDANGHLPDLQYADSEVISWKGEGGAVIEGILTYPLSYERGKSYPLLLVIHGGPMGYFLRDHTARPYLYPIQAFAAKGFAVLRPNPRGSGAYGLPFREAIVRDWGGIDYRDLMAGVDYLIKAGIADSERLGVMGWSYGGYMTSWIISQTNRFKAASVGAGLPDLVSFSNTTDVVDFIPAFFEAEVFENDAIYRERSGLFNIEGARTPTLIQHGERDFRVPPGQAWELYWALKRQGTETELVLYPRTPHGPNEPKLRLDVAEHNLRWFCERVPVEK